LIKHGLQRFSRHEDSFFINPTACPVCESVGANVNQVVHGIGTDSASGQVPEPGHWLRRILLPQDVMAFRAVARESGYDFRLLDEVMRSTKINGNASCVKFAALFGPCAARTLACSASPSRAALTISGVAALFIVQALLQEGSKITLRSTAMERVKEVIRLDSVSPTPLMKRLTARMLC